MNVRMHHDQRPIRQSYSVSMPREPRAQSCIHRNRVLCASVVKCDTLWGFMVPLRIFMNVIMWNMVVVHIMHP